uniref:Putative secreted protein n=1 Tax=Anopheles darlingi TaxID=43151 RepID=A0A2M4DEK9_ANODA
MTSMLWSRRTTCILLLLLLLRRRQMHLVKLPSTITIRLAVLIETLGRGGGRHRQLLLEIVRLAAGRLPVCPQTGRTDVLLVTARTHIRPIVRV